MTSLIVNKLKGFNMQPTFLLISIFFIFNLFPVMAFAEKQDRGIGIYIDQDFFVPFTNEDRDYTMGLAVEFFWEKEKGLYPLDGLVKTAGQWLGIDESKNEIVYSFMLGTLAYTPDDLADTQPIYDDRPYSSLIYLSNKRVRADNKNALAAEVMLGILGSNITRNAQIKSHEIYRRIAGLDSTQDPVEPKGWGHQISNGGELTMRVRVSNSRLQFSEPGQWDIATTVGLSLGFQTNANLTAAFRLGEIKSAFWSLPFDPVNRGNFLPSQPKKEWYFWTALRAHYIAYDALLQGQFKSSEVTYTGNEIERMVYDGAAGLTFGFNKSQLSISANTKSSDLKHISRRQVWGSINYLYYF